jgi:hypothetical protein
MHGSLFSIVVLFLLYNFKKMKNIIIIFFLLPIFGFSQHTAEEIAYIKEINLIRTNPKAYIQYVKEYISSPWSGVVEREIAIKELIPLLDSMKPLPAYKISEEFRKEANNHSVDSTKRYVQHDKDFSWVKIPNNGVGENITFGTDIRRSILVALIDGPSSNRGHRKNILNPTITHTSVRKVVLGNPKNRFECTTNWLQNFIRF